MNSHSQADRMEDLAGAAVLKCTESFYWTRLCFPSTIRKSTWTSSSAVSFSTFYQSHKKTCFYTSAPFHLMILLEVMSSTNSQEHLGAPIYWSPKILFSIFWKGMKRKSYDKTRFCVSGEGLPNRLRTFTLL